MIPPDRDLGRVGDATDGPLLIVVGGLHGNEPAGVFAAKRVLELLAGLDVRLRGRLVCLAGNRSALEVGERYLDRDLNRMWAGVDLARAAESGGPREREELRDLKSVLDREMAAATGVRVMLDLHSTSAPGPPFCIAGESDANIEAASRLGIPMLLGLEGTVAGTLIAHFGAAGGVALCVEGGMSDSPAATDNHAAAILVTIVGMGLLDEADIPDFASYRATLDRACVGLPGFVEVKYRHALAEGECFSMCAGFTNFQNVVAGDRLAESDRAGASDVRAPFDGVLVMPRYQGRGEDGFFLGREVARPSHVGA